MRRGRVIRRAALVAIATLASVATPTTPASAAPPTCQVTDPVGSTTVSGPSVPVKAMVPWGTTGVEFYLDGQLLGRGWDDGNWRSAFQAQGTNTFGWPSTSITNGTHTLTCRAWNPDGLGAMSPTVTFTTSNAIRTRLVGPDDGATVSGSAVQLKLDTWVSSGTLPTIAEFSVDGNVIGTGTCTWWICTKLWDSTAVNDGLHVFSAKAVGSNGAPGTSATRRMFVNNQAPGSQLLLSTYETSGWGQLGRDGGFSRQLPGDPTKSLFTFGDSGFTPGTGPDRGVFQWRFGNSNALATVTAGAAPGPLAEIPNPSGDPAPGAAMPNLVVPPAGLRDADGSSCDNGRAWTSGLIEKPGTDHLLISYLGMCHEGGTDHMQVWGLADFDPATKTAVNHDIFVNTTPSGLTARRQLGSPTIDGNYMYFFRGDSWNVYVARVPLVGTVGNPTPWFDPAQYEWKSTYAGSGWSTDPAQATNLMPPFVGAENTQVYVDRFPSVTGSPYIMVLPDPIGSPPDLSAIGKVDVWRAPSILGPWTKAIDDLSVCGGCPPGNLNLVYSVNGHPEFSSGNTISLTYYFAAWAPANDLGNATTVDRIYSRTVTMP